MKKLFEIIYVYVATIVAALGSAASVALASYDQEPLNESPGGGALGLDRFEVVPEPATLSLLALGGLPVIRRRKTV